MSRFEEPNPADYKCVEDYRQACNFGGPPAEKSGGKVNYYVIYVARPHQAEAPYFAECSDIIESLGMDFNEGEAFKALWRKAAQRNGLKKVGGDALYDAQKVAHFGKRMVALLENPDGE